LQLNKAQVRYIAKASLHACASIASEVENLNIDAAKLQTSPNMGTPARLKRNTASTRVWAVLSLPEPILNSI